MKKLIEESFEELEKLAHDWKSARPLSPAMRAQWEAALRTGARLRGRPRKPLELKSKIVPVSIEPKLLAEADKFAKRAGISRSQLVAESLRLRMKSKRKAG